MLTPKQLKLLQFVNNFVKANGHSPSFVEMKDAIGVKSKSGIFHLLNCLEERGFIKRIKGRARALEIIRSPRLYKELANLVPAEQSLKAANDVIDLLLPKDKRSSPPRIQNYLKTNYAMACNIYEKINLLGA